MTAERNKRETLTHHTMAAVGGFFGVYAIMLRGGNSGSAATGNLINLAVAGLDGSVGELLIRLGGLACYTVGIVTAGGRGGTSGSGPRRSTPSSARCWP